MYFGYTLVMCIYMCVVLLEHIVGKAGEEESRPPSFSIDDTVSRVKDLKNVPNMGREREREGGGRLC